MGEWEMIKSNRVTAFIAPTADGHKAWFQGPKSKQGKKNKNPYRYKSWEMECSGTRFEPRPSRKIVLWKIKQTAKHEHLHIHKIIYLKETVQ